MRCFKLTLAYDGTNFFGWQMQAEGRTVQDVIQQAWKAVTGESVPVVASGRTDSGVHALGQIVSCSSHTRLSSAVLQQALNASLPVDARVLEVVELSYDFHAIRDVLSKRYRYVIQNGRVHDVFQRHYSWFVPRPLDVAAMQRAAEFLIGRHDFTSFQSAGSPRKSTIRTITDLTIECQPLLHGRRILVEVEADGFLYNMVRNLVGTLYAIGLGRHPPNWAADVLRARDRRQAGPTAPPQGLFLVSGRIAPPRVTPPEDAKAVDGPRPADA